MKNRAIKRHMVLLVLTVLFALFICGAASAADSSTTNGSGSNLTNSTSAGSHHVVDPIIGVKVGYEYSSDSINPEITVKDSKGAKINATKTYDMAFKGYKLSFDYAGAVNGTKFNVSVSAPGYTTQSQMIAVFFNSANATDTNLYGSATFNMKATAAYKLGREATKKADKLLNFSKADKVLAITTAGVPKYKGVTSEDCIEGILNGSGGKITYGKGNLLMLRQTATDPVDFAFIVKKGTSLQAVVFLNGSLTPAYLGTISENMTKKQWNTYFKNVSGEDAFAFASLANAWSDGVSNDVLREATFHGHVCEGTLGGYSIVQALLKYYPPIKATSGGVGSPGDITSYKIIGVPGGSDDDAVIYFLDATPGKSGYVGFDTTATGATTNMIGFIRWTDTTYKVVTNADGTKSYVVDVPGTGSLIIMTYDNEANKKAFQAQYKITSWGSLEELKYNTWLIQKIKNDPGSLVKFNMELTGLTEEQYYYIVGTATNVTFPTAVNATNKGQTRFAAQNAHGLDLKYIKSLNLAKATRATTSTSNGSLTYDQIKNIGTNASNIAKSIFKKELGIDLEKDDRDLVVLTSAGYVYLNGQSTEAAWDGIYDVLGSRLSRSTLLPIHMAVWKPLWFTFVLRGADGKTMSTVYLRYDPSTGKFFIGNNSEGKQVNDIGPVALNNATTVSDLSTNFIPDGNWFNIQSIANAWRNDPAFDQLLTFLFHDHACPGVQPGFFITEYIQKNYPLSGNQSYFWMASSIYCKDDSLVYLLGVSPGMGTYMDQRLSGEETTSEYLPGGTEEGMIVVWDPDTKTGKVAIVSFKWPTYNLDGLTTSEAQREAMISAFISMYKGESSPYIKEPLSLVTSHETYITAQEFARLQAGGTSNESALAYVKGLPVRSLSDILNQGNSNNGSQNGQNGQNGNHNGNSTSNSQQTSSNSNGQVTGSVGDSGPTVSAATQTEVTNQAGETPGAQQGNTYEVSKAAPQSEESEMNYLLIAIGAILCGGLLVVGFFKGSILGFLRK
ncbi:MULTISPECIES: FmdE family protein [Methanobacterium]|uniref:FmdE family protein n=1 Tax=Methanobacterium veterum TaxID=408577 RepID=A0A9E5A5Z2_9EURY|nr:MULTISPECIES: FmdE family protein [Methanobacterium]MCZ3367151.1 FmdE family protein [Methanobacterium veterum]MCZ3373701.1 FmdE family protein [Methanobacterium veterum]